MPKSPLTLVEPGATVPPPPRTLGSHGLSLWTRVQREYRILDCGGIELLCLACQALDRAESLSEAIAAEGQTICTRSGIKAHPALRDELANRAFITRALARLGIATEPVKSPGRPAGGALGWIPPA
jgi:hypothetical protein